MRRGQCALELIERHARLKRSHGVDQIRDRFRLNQIDSSVQERAESEFAWPRQSRACRDRASQHGLKNDRTAMRADLDAVLAGVRMRGRKPGGDDFVHWALSEG